MIIVTINPKTVVAGVVVCIAIGAVGTKYLDQRLENLRQTNTMVRQHNEAMQKLRDLGLLHEAKEQSGLWNTINGIWQLSPKWRI